MKIKTQIILKSVTTEIVIDLSPYGVKSGHWTNGGTGVTNIGSNREAQRETYIKAAYILGLSNSIYVLEVDMSGKPGMWSLHYTDIHTSEADLSDFWRVVEAMSK